MFFPFTCIRYKSSEFLGWSRNSAVEPHRVFAQEPGIFLLCGMRHQVSTKNMFFHEQLSSISDIRSLLYYMIIYKVYCVSISYPQGVDVCRFINHKKKHLVAGRVRFLNPAISTDKTRQIIIIH